MPPPDPEPESAAPCRWSWSGIALLVLGVACLAIAVTSRVGWPWRFHLLPMANDHERDSMRDPGTMTPWEHTIVWLCVGLAGVWWAWRTRRNGGAGGTSRLSLLVSACVAAALFSEWCWLMAWNGV